MKSFGIVTAGVILFSLSAHASDFKVYPNAKLDQVEMQKYQAQLSGLDAQTRKMVGVQSIYTTNDDFQKVYAFYKNLYKETDLNIKKTNTPMPGGKMLNDAFFCLDGSDSIAKSKYWMKIQNPFIGDAKLSPRSGDPGFNDVRNITVISVVKK
jgi:hypothetical protein